MQRGEVKISDENIFYYPGEAGGSASAGSGNVDRQDENNPGAEVYIGDDGYDCCIGNGSTYDRYTVKIGSGTAWD